MFLTTLLQQRKYMSNFSVFSAKEKTFPQKRKPFRKSENLSAKAKTFPQC
jgi:hypothetical protein